MEKFILPSESPSQILVNSLDPYKMSKAVYLIEIILSLIIIMGSMSAMAQSKKAIDLNSHPLNTL